eukprot:1421476-Ditylum_brightwellii.AAC.1
MLRGVAVGKPDYAAYDSVVSTSQDGPIHVLRSPNRVRTYGAWCPHRTDRLCWTVQCPVSRKL